MKKLYPLFLSFAMAFTIVFAPSFKAVAFSPTSYGIAYKAIIDGDGGGEPTKSPYGVEMLKSRSFHFDISQPIFINPAPDPIRFSMVCDRDSIKAGEEFTLTITATWLDIPPTLMFYFPEQQSFALKVLTPMGFVQTGGDYYDFIGTRLGGSDGLKEVSYTLKGKMVSDGTASHNFTLLRGVPPIVENSLFEKKAEVSLMMKEAAIYKPFSVKELTYLTPRRTLVMNAVTDVLTITGSGAVCGGGAFTLTANGCNGTITWTGSSQPYSITGNSASFFAYNITQADIITTYRATCSTGGYAEKNVTIYYRPNGTPTISGNTLLSSNTSTTTLTATGCQSNESVKWSTGEIKPSITVGPGSYSAQCQNNGCEASGFIFTPVTVCVVPHTVGINASKTVICDGESITLTATGLYYGYIGWSNNMNGDIYNTLPYQVTPHQNTIYKLIAYPQICPNDTATIAITVKPVPNLTASGSYDCAGGSISLSANGGSSYQWSGPNSFSSTLQSPPIANAVSAYDGVYSVTASNTGGCIASTTLSVSVLVTPTITHDLLVDNGGIYYIRTGAVGPSRTLTANGCSGASITWKAKSDAQGSTEQVVGTGNTLTIDPNMYIATTFTLTCTKGACTKTSVPLYVQIDYCSESITIAAVPSVICKNDYTTINVNNCTGVVTWNDLPATSHDVIRADMQPQITTTYNATCTKNHCATVTASKQVIVENAPAINISATATTIDLNQNTTLTLTGCTTNNVVWKNAAGQSYTQDNNSIVGTSKLTISPSATNSYYATCTHTQGCVRTSTGVQINVNACTPNASSLMVSGLGSKCAGQSFTLTVSGCNGSVRWGSNGSISNTMTTSLSVTKDTTIYCIKTGCEIISKTITIPIIANTKPVLSASIANPVTQGSSLWLNASGCTNGIIAWSNVLATEKISTQGDNVQITATVTKKYVATCTKDGCTGTDTLNVIVVEGCPTSMVISGNTGAICKGSSISLSAGCGTGSSVVWTDDLNNMVSMPVAPTSTTTYKATCTKGGTCTVTATTSVVVNSPPQATANSTVTCGNTFSLSLTTSGGNTYTWAGPSGSGFSSTLQNPSISGVTATKNNGTYSVTVIDTNGCSISLTTSVSITCTVCSTVAAPTISVPVTTTVMAGKTVSLSAIGCPTGTIVWKGGQTGTSINVSQSLAGKYTYKTVCKLTNNCTSDSSNAVMITVIPEPCQATINPNPATATAGIPLNLSASNGVYDGNGLQLNGSSRINGLVTASNGFSFEAWVNPSAALGTSYTNDRHLISPIASGYFGLAVGTNGIKVYEQPYGVSSWLNTLSYTGAITQWTHICLSVYSGLPRLYVNGVLVAQQTSVQVTNYPAMTVQQIGSAANGWGGYQGGVDEIRFWNYNRTTEILGDYWKRLSGSESGLLLYLPLESINANGSVSSLNGTNYASTGTMSIIKGASNANSYSWYKGTETSSFFQGSVAVVNPTASGTVYTVKTNLNGTCTATISVSVAPVMCQPAISPQPLMAVAGVPMSLSLSNGVYDGKGVAFSGASTARINGLVTANNSFTFEAWVNPSAALGTSYASDRHLISPTANGYVGLAVGTDGLRVYEQPYVGTAWGLSLSYMTPITQWTHVTLSVLNGIPTLYINGIQVAQRSGGAMITNYPAMTMQQIGSSATTGGAYQGSVDELRFWNRVRTPAEVLADYKKTLTGTESGLIFYLPLESINTDGTVNTKSGTKLTASGITGVNAVSSPLPYQYQWTGSGNFSSTVNAPVLTITPTQTGSATYTVSTGLAGGLTCTATASVSVQPMACNLTISPNTNLVATGQAITLTANNTTSYTNVAYTWKSSIDASFASTGATANITSTQGCIYTATYGVCTASVSISPMVCNLTVSPTTLPDVFVGGTIALTANNATSYTGVNYVWSSSTDNTYSASSPSISSVVKQPTTFTVKYGTCSASVTVTPRVCDLKIVSGDLTNVFVGQAINLTATSTPVNKASYQWTATGGTFTSTQAQATLSTNIATTVSVVYDVCSASVTITPIFCDIALNINNQSNTVLTDGVPSSLKTLNIGDRISLSASLPNGKSLPTGVSVEWSHPKYKHFFNTATSSDSLQTVTGTSVYLEPQNIGDFIYTLSLKQGSRVLCSKDIPINVTVPCSLAIEPKIIPALWEGQAISLTATNGDSPLLDKISSIWKSSTDNAFVSTGTVLNTTISQSTVYTLQYGSSACTATVSVIKQDCDFSVSAEKYEITLGDSLLLTATPSSTMSSYTEFFWSAPYAHFKGYTDTDSTYLKDGREVMIHPQEAGTYTYKAYISGNSSCSKTLTVKVKSMDCIVVDGKDYFDGDTLVVMQSNSPLLLTALKAPNILNDKAVWTGANALSDQQNAIFDRSVSSSEANLVTLYNPVTSKYVQIKLFVISENSITCNNFSINNTQTATIEYGQSISLTASTCSGNISWNNGATSATISVSPVSNTTYSATCKGVFNLLFFKIPYTCNATINVIVNNRIVLPPPIDDICGTCNVQATASTNTIWQSTLNINSEGKQESDILPSDVTFYNSSLNRFATLSVLGCNGIIEWYSNQKTEKISNEKQIFVYPQITTIYKAKCILSDGNICSKSIKIDVKYYSSCSNVSIERSSNTGTTTNPITLTAKGCPNNGTVTWFITNQVGIIGTGNSISVIPPNKNVDNFGTSYEVECVYNWNFGKDIITSICRKSTLLSNECSSFSAYIDQNKIEVVSTGCNGTVKWSDGLGDGEHVLIKDLNTARTYTATCQATGCTASVYYYNCSSIKLVAKRLSCDRVELNAEGGCVTGVWKSVESSNIISNKSQLVVSLSQNKSAQNIYSYKCFYIDSNCEKTIFVYGLPFDIGIFNKPVINGKGVVNDGESVTLYVRGCADPTTGKAGKVYWNNAVQESEIALFGIPVYNVGKLSSSTTVYASCKDANGNNFKDANGVELSCVASLKIDINYCPNFKASVSAQKIYQNSSVSLSATGCNGATTWKNVTDNSIINTANPTVYLTKVGKIQFQAICTTTTNRPPCTIDQTVDVLDRNNPPTGSPNLCNTSPAATTSSAFVANRENINLYSQGCIDVGGIAIWQDITDLNNVVNITTAAAATQSYTPNTDGQRAFLYTCKDSKSELSCSQIIAGPPIWDCDDASFTISKTVSGFQTTLHATGCYGGIVSWKFDGEDYNFGNSGIDYTVASTVNSFTAVCAINSITTSNDLIGLNHCKKSWTVAELPIYAGDCPSNFDVTVSDIQKNGVNAKVLEAIGCPVNVSWDIKNTASPYTSHEKGTKITKVTTGNYTYTAHCKVDLVDCTIAGSFSVSNGSGKIGGAGGRLGLPQDTPQNATTGAVECTVPKQQAMNSYLAHLLKDLLANTTIFKDENGNLSSDLLVSNLGVLSTIMSEKYGILLDNSNINMLVTNFVSTNGTNLSSLVQGLTNLLTGEMVYNPPALFTTLNDYVDTRSKMIMEAVDIIRFVEFNRPDFIPNFVLTDDNDVVFSQSQNQTVSFALYTKLYEQWRDKKLDVSKETACYPTTWKRLVDAYQEVTKSIPNELNNKGFSYIDYTGNKRWYPKNNTDFAILFASYIDEGAIKWKTLPDIYRGKGAAGAMVFIGYAEMIDNVWDGTLIPGAVIQFWDSQTSYEKIKSGIGLDPKKPNEVGHSVIFFGYKKDVVTGDIIGIRYADQHGLWVIPLSLKATLPIFGANILDSKK